MPSTLINKHYHYYVQTGEGPWLVLVHGAFVDSRMWKPQVRYFQSNYRILRYDLRGHGKTGPSNLDRYSISAFADDLASLLESLKVQSPILCGMSLGGIITQAFAVQHPGVPRALILAGTAASVDLTFQDKLLRYVFFPKWAMHLTVRMMSVENFTRFSMWLARTTRGEQWLGRNEDTRIYIEKCMREMDGGEFLKICEAVYDFYLLPLERIKCPTLVLNGEFEGKIGFHHTKEILRRMPQAEARVVPGAGHASNTENPEAFNQLVEEFLNFHLP